MIIYDPLYGEFALDAGLTRLAQTPEVRRLSQVRLLNTLTPSLATLGELRRYSHTLGVLYLCERNAARGFSVHERTALSASVLLHDIGTPPFGHLMEYHLRELSGWSHEEIIRPILWGTHAPENRAHQIFGGRAIEFRTALRDVGVSIELVQAIVTGIHPLSVLLFGSLDLDNLDNVARMNWALGTHGSGPVASRIAAALGVSRAGKLLLSRKDHEGVVERWRELRRRAYEVIVFDPPTVAAQAVLSQALEAGLSTGLISRDDWSLSDEAMLDRLRSDPVTKDAISLEYLGVLPALVFCVQIAGELPPLGLSSRKEGILLVEGVLRDEFQTDRVLGYVFPDRGAFEKQIEFCDPDTSETWLIGETSSSVVFYGFLRSRKSPSKSQCARAVRSLLERLPVGKESLVRCQIGSQLERDDAQGALAFPDSRD